MLLDWGRCHLFPGRGSRGGLPETHKLIRQGRIDEGLESRSRLSSSLTFSECADQLIKSKLSEWKNPKSEKQWRSTLTRYAYPVVGQMKIENVTTKEIMSILEPHWLEKTDTMTKLRGRLQKILDWATTYGYRQGLNPATWEGNLEHLLPAPSRITRANTTSRFLFTSTVGVWGYKQFRRNWLTLSRTHHPYGGSIQRGQTSAVERD